MENASEPIYETIKRRKLFFVSDMDEEAEYLHEMSLQGYHFIKKKGMCYYFRQGEPINYYYHLGYYEKDKRDGGRYLDNYVAAGWEDVYHEKGEVPRNLALFSCGNANRERLSLIFSVIRFHAWSCIIDC